MKKVISIILIISLISVFLISCASNPMEGVEVTPSPSPTTSEEPPKTAEVNYDDVVLPEPKSQKWKSYDRIIFSLFRMQDPQTFMVEVDENGNEIWPVYKDEMVFEHDINEMNDVFCGAYSFTQDANGFLCSYNDLENDDMVYVEVEIVNERLRDKISWICDKRYNEAQKLKTKQSDKYWDKWHEFRQENGPNYIVKLTRDFFRMKITTYLYA